MKRALIAVSAVVVGLAAPAATQAASLTELVDGAVNACVARVASKELTSRVQIVNCVNRGMEGVYTDAHWPYMAAFYKFASVSLLNAADADAGKITEPEYEARQEAARLAMSGDVESAFSEQRARAAAAQESYDAANQQAARTAEQQRRSAVLGIMLRNNQPVRSATPVYQLPPPPAPSPSFNCTTNNIGQTAFTNCR